MAASEIERQAYGPFADQIVAGQEAAAAMAPRWGSTTNWSVDTGEGAQWNRLRRLASDPAALANALQAQGWGEFRG